MVRGIQFFKILIVKWTEVINIGKLWNTYIQNIRIPFPFLPVQDSEPPTFSLQWLVTEFRSPPGTPSQKHGQLHFSFMSKLTYHGSSRSTLRWWQVSLLSWVYSHIYKSGASKSITYVGDGIKCDHTYESIYTRSIPWPAFFSPFLVVGSSRSRNAVDK